jgi:hypothetical protein
MDTAELRQLTRHACLRLGGKLWPNGIGFDRRGWQFTYSERTNRWTASRPQGGYATTYGEGPTPETAQAHARHKARDPHCSCNDCIADLQEQEAQP